MLIMCVWRHLVGIIGIAIWLPSFLPMSEGIPPVSLSFSSFFFSFSSSSFSSSSFFLLVFMYYFWEKACKWWRGENPKQAPCTEPDGVQSHNCDLSQNKKLDTQPTEPPRCPPTPTSKMYSSGLPCECFGFSKILPHPWALNSNFCLPCTIKLAKALCIPWLLLYAQFFSFSGPPVGMNKCLKGKSSSKCQAYLLIFSSFWDLCHLCAKWLFLA